MRIGHRCLYFRVHIVYIFNYLQAHAMADDSDVEFGRLPTGDCEWSGSDSEVEVGGRVDTPEDEVESGRRTGTHRATRRRSVSTPQLVREGSFWALATSRNAVGSYSVLALMRIDWDDTSWLHSCRGPN